MKSYTRRKSIRKELCRDSKQPKISHFFSKTHGEPKQTKDQEIQCELLLNPVIETEMPDVTLIIDKNGINSL